MLPALSILLPYGARATDKGPSNRSKEKDDAKVQTAKDSSPWIVRYIANIKVPHSWFTSFYALSVSLSIIWGTQLLTKGPLFRALASQSSSSGPSMSLPQIIATWTMMFVQGSRRLYECLAIAKPSSSQMWIGHWLVGVLFYSCVNIAVWLEGASERSEDFPCSISN